MVVVPLSTGVNESSKAPGARNDKTAEWIRFAAAGTLAASGALIVSGKRKAGLLAAVSGTALVVIDQQDAVREWWSKLPGFLQELHELLGRAEDAVDDLSTQSQRLRSALGK
jgi:hypothetical protein